LVGNRTRLRSKPDEFVRQYRERFYTNLKVYIFESTQTIVHQTLTAFTSHLKKTVDRADGVVNGDHGAFSTQAGV
jgi:hypothetical protein